MNERSKWIEYKGKKLFHMDLSGLEEIDQLKILENSSEKWINSNEKTILLINDVRNTYTTEEIKIGAKRAIQAVKDNGKNIFVALIGITGIKRIIANAIEKNMYFSKNIEDAKEWLIKQM
jgi:hypothetical protein